MSPRRRKKRPGPPELRASWSKRQQDIVFHFSHRADGRLLHGMFEGYPALEDQQGNRIPWTEELERRGYDVSTLRFSIRNKPRTPRTCERCGATVPHYYFLARERRHIDPGVWAPDHHDCLPIGASQ